MKQILLFIAAIMMIVSSCKEPPPTKTTTLADFTPYNRSPMILKGQVKSLTWRTYWAKEVDGKIEKGEIITRSERDSLNLMSDWNLLINEDGHLTKTEYISYDGQINYWDFEILDNKLVKAIWNYLGESRVYWTFSYDDNGKLIERSRYRIGVDTLLNKQIATYYENGFRKEILNFNFKEQLTGKQIWKWNDSGQSTEYLTYDASDKLTSTMEVGYDENGNLTNMVFDSPDRGVRTFEFRDLILDDMGNFTSCVSYRDDKLFSVSKLNIEYY